MNTSNPLIPQGTLLDQKNKGRARVRLAVFFVLTIHVIGLMALLMQGCKRDTGTDSGGTAATNTPATQTFEPTNPPVADTALAASNTALPPPLTNEAPATSEYVVQRGDSFYTIARKFGVTIKGIQDANPGVQPTKLQLGQKLHIPPPTRAEAAAAPVATNGSGAEIYVVKSGDTLSKIATDHSTTVKAIRAANNLVTDKIKVGDKLKIPKASAPPPATAPTSSSPADAAPSNPTPAPGTAPPPAR
jgi:LysM repeat protein